MALKLYGYWRSSCTWRVRIVLAWKRLPYDYVPINLRPGVEQQHGAAYAALNPLAEVPALAFDDQNGQTRLLTQSLAIIDYLDTVAAPPLVPSDPWLRARARQLAEVVNAGTQPLQNAGTLARVRGLGGDAEAWARHFIARGLHALETIGRESAGTYMVADNISVADVCLVPQIYNARRMNVDLAPYPTLTRVESACLALPAFAESHPNRQPDADP